MIRYPFLKQAATIGVTAPSSGAVGEFQDLLKLAGSRMETNGYQVVFGDTAWMQEKAKSAPAQVRAAEFNDMMGNEQIDIIIPPWGGELLIEMLEYIDYEQMGSKWILGYSDISVLLLVITLRTGMATAHGTNLLDLRSEVVDETTAQWQAVLSTKAGDSVLQHSSVNYQKEWSSDSSSSSVFHLTEPTEWKTVSADKVIIQGRLLGGCIDIIRHIIGTPFGDLQHFQQQLIPNEPIVWYLENCELNTTDLRRSLVQMKLAGWFEHCSGILFGRSAANTPIDNYTAEDVYQDLARELQLPVIYEIDCGHVPPQITFINGAYAEIEVEGGKGRIRQYFLG